MIQTRYETARLALRLAAPELSAAVAAYYRRNRDFLTAYEPARAESFFTEEGQRALLTEDAAQAAGDRGYRFWLSRREAPEEVIGLVGLGTVVRGGFQSCFLGYKLDQELLNRGFMTEAVVESVRIAFEELGLHRVEANIMPRNTPSLRVAEKAGFYQEGLALKYLRINGVWEDHIHMVRRSDQGHASGNSETTEIPY